MPNNKSDLQSLVGIALNYQILKQSLLRLYRCTRCNPASVMATYNYNMASKTNRFCGFSRRETRSRSGSGAVNLRSWITSSVPHIVFVNAIRSAWSLVRQAIQFSASVVQRGQVASNCLFVRAFRYSAISAVTAAGTTISARRGRQQYHEYKILALVGNTSNNNNIIVIATKTACKNSKATTKQRVLGSETDDGPFL